jgi:hypothetical protein
MADDQLLRWKQKFQQSTRDHGILQWDRPQKDEELLIRLFYEKNKNKSMAEGWKL